MKRRLLLFFTITYFLSWSCFYSGLTSANFDGSVASIRNYIIVGSFGPTIAALIMLLSQGDRSSAIRAWLASAIKVKVNWAVYIVVLFLVPAVAGSLIWILGVQPADGRSVTQLYTTLVGLSAVNGFVGVFIGGGALGEEPGWRGYALPRLSELMSDAHLSVMLGTIWAVWHLPILLCISEWRGEAPIATFLPIYWIGVVSVSYIMTKLWNWSGGSLFIMIWFHGILNAVGGLAFDPRYWSVELYGPTKVALLQSLILVISAALIFVMDRRTFSTR